MKNYLSENNTKIIGVLESKYDTDISSELTSQMDELVEFGNQIEKVYQKFEVEPETEEVIVEE